MQLLFVLVLLAGSTGLPVQDGAAHHANDGPFPRTLPQERANRGATGFKYVYVDQAGNVYDTKSTVEGTQVEVAGSPKTSDRGLQTAASVVAKMVKFMPGFLFPKVAEKGSVGVFTAAEKTTVYPEFAQRANGKCGTSCAGACAHTCTADGRKFEDLAGLADERAIVVEDNLLCTENDPYRKLQNIIVHEFTHTIHRHVLPPMIQKEITEAYQNAKSKGIWENTSYALSDELEYFAEGATVFLNVNHNNVSSGGMAYCDEKPCTSLKDARKHLSDKDMELYRLLNWVFVDYKSRSDSGLTLCPPS